ncbi:MAG: tape measure protein [Liquorilactobacillus mali]|uniref:tape measure protein n=1 Tax=Liquorilactobacillus mali TaxID=1618 RepID=UPI0039ED8160
MSTVQNEMATRVALDTISAVNSLKGLKDAVGAATSAWKANATAMSSSGDTLGALQSKVKGIGEVIDLQKQKISELKTRQEGLDTTTQKGAETYLKLQKQIDSTNNQISSLTAQQDRAKSSMGYYSSGLADLQKGFKNAETANKAYTERLEAEGKQEEANKARMSGLKQSLSNLSSQYEKQESELQKIASTSGVTSEAYLKQKTRLDETGTSVAKTKTQINELREAMDKKATGFMDGVKSKLTDVNDKAEKTSHLFGTILGAHLVANGITSALASIQANFSALKDTVVEYNNKQQTMKATWDTLTGSGGAGTNMVNIGNKLATAYNQNIDIVDELNQSFYHVFDNAPETEKLTKSVLTLGDTLNLSDENVTRLGTNFTHMLSSGKMQLGDFNMINDQLPMYAGKMLEFEQKQQKNSKLTMSTLRDQMSAGKISAKDAEAVMNSLGSKYQEASENLMKTIPGMERSIKTQMPALVNAVYQPLANMKSPFIGQITKWIQNPDTKKEFSAVGDALQLQISDIMKAFGGKSIDVGGGLDKFLFNLQTGIDKLGSTIVAHKDQIKELFASMKTASKTSFSVLVQTLKDLEPVLAIVGKLAADHPKTFAAIAANGLIASKAVSGLSLAFKGFDVASTLLGKTWKGIKFPLGVFKNARTEGTKTFKVFQGFGKVFSGISNVAKASFSATVGAMKDAGIKIAQQGKIIGKSLKWTAKIAYTGAKKSVSLLWTGIKATGKLIGNGLKWTASVAVKGAQLAMAGLLKTAKVTGTGLKLAFNFLKANPFILIVSAISAVVVALVELYKHNKKFRDFVNGIIKSAQKIWKDVVKYFTQLWKDTVRTVENLYKGVTGWFGSMKKGIGTHVSNTWKNTKNAFSDGWNTTKKLTSDGVGKVGDWFNNMKKTTGNLMASMWKSHKSLFKDGYKVVGDYTSTWHDVMTGKWGKVGGDLKNTLNDLVKFWKNVFKGAYDWINKLTGGRLGDVLNTFKSIFDKIKGVVSGAIKDVHDSFVGITRGIIKPFNDLLGGLEKGINWVLDKVGASKIKGTWSIPLPSYAKGTANTQGTHPGGLALVNDAKGSKYREMFKLPTGEVGMFPAQRNMIVPLPKGTSVLNGNSSFELAQSLGLPKYASGIGSFFSGLFNKGKNLLEDADKIIAHPMEFLESMFTKFTGSISSNIGLASDIITNLPKTIASNAVDWVKKLFSDDVGNIKGTATPTQAKDIISKAMGLAGVSGDNWLNGLETIAKYESGFRNVTNNWDSNAKAGHPSSGWFQMIESTFDAYAKKGYTKWTNPLDQAISAIGYIKSRYGGIANVPGIKSLAKGGKYVGYANGGSVSTEGLYTLAEGNKTEYVIPTDYSKHNRAVQLLDDAKRAVTGTGLSDETSSKLDTLIEQQQQMITLFSQLLNKDQSIVLDTGTLVGSTQSKYDAANYNVAQYQQRNVWGG